MLTAIPPPPPGSCCTQMEQNGLRVTDKTLNRWTFSSPLMLFYVIGAWSNGVVMPVLPVLWRSFAHARLRNGCVSIESLLRGRGDSLYCRESQIVLRMILTWLSRMSFLSLFCFAFFCFVLWFPRYYACLCGHHELVEYLLQNGQFCQFRLKLV